MVNAAALGYIDGVLQGHGLWVTEIEPVAGFGHHNGGLPVRTKVHVVRIVYFYGWAAGLAGARVNWRETAFVGALCVIGNP